MSRPRRALFAAVLAWIGICSDLTTAAEAQELAAPAGDEAAVSQGTGVVLGQVFDRDSGAPLSGADVSVEDGDQTTTSGVDGAFRLPRVPAGSRTIVIARPGYQTMRVEGVNVRAGDATPITASLGALLAPPEGDSDAGLVPYATGEAAGNEVVQMEAFTVTAETQQANTRAAFVALRKYAPVSVDTISAAEIAKFTGSDVSQVMIRMPGVSVASHGAFAVIRGLSERYNTTTLDGIPLPSSDPERQSVELDQFPAKLIDGLVVYKNFAPNLPGNLTGGGVEIKPVSFPSRRTVSLSLGLSMDEGVFGGGDFLGYRALRSRDWLGKGAGGRIPTDQTYSGDDIYGAEVDLEPDAKQLHSMPQGSFFLGETFDLPHDRQLGVVLSGSYQSSQDTEDGINGNDREWSLVWVPQDEGGEYTVRYNNRLPQGYYEYTRSVSKVLAGAYAGVSLRIDQNNSIGVSYFLAQAGSDFTEQRQNIVQYGQTSQFNSSHILHDPAIDQSQVDRAYVFDYTQNKIRYRERNLTSYVARGTSRFPALNGTSVEWAFSRSKAYQDEPNTRVFRYGKPVDESQYEIWQTTDSGEVGRGIWRKVDEDLLAGAVDIDVPFRVFRASGMVRAGASTASTDRNYNESVGVLTFAGTGGGVSIVENPDDFSDILSERLVLHSSVAIERDLRAHYISASLPITRWLKIDGGVRFERTKFTSEGFGGYPANPQVPTIYIYTAANRESYFYTENQQMLANGWTPEYAFSAHIDQEDALPGVSLTIDPTSSFRIRMSASKTIARPSLREIGNYFTSDDDGNPYFGNATLRLSEVRNADIRFEYLFDDTDLAGISFFYKEIDDAIMAYDGVPSSVGSASHRSWFNVPGTAEVSGVELEMRRGLGFLGDPFEPFSLGGNVSLIDVQAPSVMFVFHEGAVASETTGPLYDQPGWLLNLDATCEIRSWGLRSTLAFRASDRVMVAAGGANGAGEWLDGSATLDLTIRKSFGERAALKLSMNNLLDPERSLVPDEDVLGGESIYTKRWRDGRAYSLALSYDY